jgi:transaldolase
LLTAVYNHVQVVPAIIAGATYLAPYLGRMNDAGLDGVAEIAQMQTVIDKARAAARILVASIRTPDQLARLAMCGVQDFTIAPKLWWELLSEPLTDAAVGVFDANARELMS